MSEEVILDITTIEETVTIDTTDPEVIEIKVVAVTGGASEWNELTGTADKVPFTTANGGPTALGELAWLASTESLALRLKNGENLDLGEETVYHVQNNSGSTIAKGAAVSYAGTTGASGKLRVKLWNGSTDLPEAFMGLAMGAIATGETGYVTAFGAIRGVNTSGFSDGVILYANPAGTGLTSTKPTGTHVVAAVCINAGNNGTLLARPTIGGYVETTDATSDATPNTIVKRNGSGNSAFVSVQTNSLNASEGIETFSAYIKGESYYDTAATFAYESPAAATHRTALGLGTAATANSSAFAAASHTHGNISNGGTIGTTADLAVVTGSGGALTVTSRSGIDSRTSFPNADVTAATSTATGSTLVRRDTDGSAVFTGISGSEIYAGNLISTVNYYSTGNVWFESGSTFTYEAGVAATHRTALGLGTAATANSSAFQPAGSYVVEGDARLTDAREWTASTVSQAEAEAGTATTRRAWTAERVRQAVVGWYGTLSAAFRNFVATPTSANLATLLTDENGTGGGFVRAEGATLTSPSLVGPVNLTSQDASTADRVMTRGLADARYLSRISSIVYSTGGQGWTTATSGAGTSAGFLSSHIRLESANSTQFGAISAWQANERVGVGSVADANFSFINFAQEIWFHISMRSRAFNVSNTSWAVAFGNQPTVAGIAAIFNDSLSFATVGLECVNGSVRVVTKNGINPITRSSVFDTWSNNANTKGYSVRISSGVVTVFNANGQVIATHSNGVPTLLAASYFPVIAVESTAASAPQNGIIIQHLSLSW